MAKRVIRMLVFVIGLVGEITSPADAAPAFTDENWVSMGDVSAFDGQVYSLLGSESSVYAGGNFRTIGGLSAQNVAKWDGSKWLSLGGGLSPWSSVYAMALCGNDLYVGGSFMTVTNADGAMVEVSAIAKWDGTNWSSLGRGLTDAYYGNDQLRVNALAVIGTNVYVAGRFTCATNADGTYVEANSISRWDGNRWSAVGQGFSEVLTLLAVGDVLYAGGRFTTAGELPVNRVAKWDGTTWSPLGTGIGSDDPEDGSVVRALTMRAGNLYAGGSFELAGGNPARSLARWDGSNWSPITSNDNTNCVSVSALANFGTYVCVAGTFSTAAGQSVTQVAKWDGDNWSPMTSEHFTCFSALAVCGKTIYAEGSFTIFDEQPLRQVMKWDGNRWSALASGMECEIGTLVTSGKDIYAGGAFTLAGAHRVNYVAKWDGATWSGLSSGMNGYVSALAMSGANLYAGGNFTSAGGIEANLVAKWDGSSWSALGSGLQGLPPDSGEDYPSVGAIAVSGSNVFVGGEFGLAGDIPALRIAWWNGSVWTPLGSGVEGPVYDLAISDTNLFVAGYFTVAGGVPATNVARWDGSRWWPLGSGPDQEVYALAVSGTNLYAGGSYGVQKWDGTRWSPLGERAISPVAALAFSGDELYAAGDFSGCVAKWDGVNWTSLGSGLSDGFESAYTIAITDRQLYVGGGFLKAGGKPAPFIAKAFLDGLPLEFKKSSRVSANGCFEAWLSGPSGAQVSVDASTNLVHWEPLYTNNMPTNGWPFWIPLSPHKHQFYRARFQL